MCVCVCVCKWASLHLSGWWRIALLDLDPVTEGGSCVCFCVCVNKCVCVFICMCVCVCVQMGITPFKWVVENCIAVFNSSDRGGLSGDWEKQSCDGHSHWKITALGDWEEQSCDGHSHWKTTALRDW